jgi:adenine-specific DNA-methyltransferase
MATVQAIPDEAVEHGEVFTRSWIVDLILDLAGYNVSRDLGSMVAVEPACGAGAFLGPMVMRLSSSCRARGHTLADVHQAIRAFDLLAHNVESSRRLVEKILTEDEWDATEAATVAEEWVREGDYLLAEDVPTVADFVLGNPPYIRLEDVPSDRMGAYRAVCPTMIGRADVYVGFFETGLRSLAPQGTLAFICADRWMRNQYGRELRRLVTKDFSIQASITMHDVDAFHEQVSAYPAVTVLRRARQGSAVVADTTREFSASDASALVRWSRRKKAAPVSNARYEVARLPRWFDGSDSWPSGSPARLALIEDLNDRFHPLEDPETGTRVGIGVATGADGVFVTKNANVEHDRLLPLSMVRDTASGTLSWSGHFLVNPWDSNGRLVDLAAYPLLRSYFERHGENLRNRHVAGKAPAGWYRTIDKVDHTLTARTKLLFPDMKMTIHPVLDEGGLYPHHNLYYVISDQWDLSVLGGLLLSRVAGAFVEAYAVKMRGGTLRFQAQYLRRIRVPYPSEMLSKDQAALADAFRKRDVVATTKAAIRVYGISDQMGDLINGPASVRASRS